MLGFGVPSPRTLQQRLMRAMALVSFLEHIVATLSEIMCTEEAFVSELDDTALTHSNVPCINGGGHAHANGEHRPVSLASKGAVCVAGSVPAAIELCDTDVGECGGADLEDVC